QGFCIVEVIFDKKKNPIDYRFLETNPVFEHQTGLKNPIGKTMKELEPAHEESWFETYGKISLTRQPQHFEMQAAHLAGGVWFEVFAFPFGPEGSNQVAVLFNDITLRKRNDAALHESEDKKSFFLKLSDAIRFVDDPVVIQEIITSLTMQQFDADRCYFCEIKGGQAIIHRDSRKEGLQSVAGSYSLTTIPILKVVIDAGKTFVVADVSDTELVDEDLRKLCVQLQVISFIDVPVIKNGRAIGLLCIVQGTPRQWTSFEIRLAEETAERTWIALERANGERALRLKEKLVKAQNEAFRAAIDDVPLGECLNILSRIVSEPTEGKIRSVFYIANQAFTSPDQIKGAGNVDGENLDETLGFDIGKDLFPGGVSQISNTPVLIPDVYDDPLWKPWLKIADAHNFRGCASFPILTKDNKPVGTFAMFFSTPHVVTDEELTLANVVIQTASIIISRHQEAQKRAVAEEDLKKLNLRLQEMDKAKTDFFNNVSHEFRTPLTLLISPLEEVIHSAKETLTPGEFQRLQISYRGAQRLHRLVNNLLDFMRIEAGKIEAFYQPTEFSKTTIELAANFRSVTEKAGLRFIVKPLKSERRVYLNREMWEKIVFNLLSNAFKFTHYGKIEVVLREKKKNVELKVKDTGIGIPKRDLDRIFQRFNRVNNQAGRSYEGTGIGLALVRELVHAHGGVIKVKSKEGKGSEFIVSIPKGKEHLPKQQIFETRDTLSGEVLSEPFIDEASGWRSEDEKLMKRKLKKPKSEGSPRILIAEDNADMRDYLTSVLMEDKYEIIAMEDGQKILTYLRNGGNADLILADVMMPVVDGYELVQWITSDPKFMHIPIVLLSARSTEEARIEGLNLGAHDYLVKPFSAEELRAIVRSRIRGSGKIAGES
ncbi:MAG TPA: ATP-binding protein, partial [Cyclobacteriaceae bacterium]|nr:ATP-binding protein [Cyclobacteriaceae bacterium]